MKTAPYFASFCNFLYRKRRRVKTKGFYGARLGSQVRLQTNHQLVYLNRAALSLRSVDSLKTASGPWPDRKSRRPLFQTLLNGIIGGRVSKIAPRLALTTSVDGQNRFCEWIAVFFMVPLIRRWQRKYYLLIIKFDYVNIIM